MSTIQTFRGMARRASNRPNFTVFKPAIGDHNRGYANTIVSGLSPSQPQELPVTDYDIVIVGGGPVGLALANAFAFSQALRESGSRISVLDAADLSKLKAWKLPAHQWSNRVAAVTNENLEFLNKIGVLQHLDQTRTRTMSRLHLRDGLSNAKLAFDSIDEPGSSLLGSPEVPQMCRIIELVHLQRAMLQNLENHSNVDVYGSAKVANIAADETKRPVVSMQDGRKIRARLLVGADGYNSPVKSFSKIKSPGWNYDSHGLVGCLELSPTTSNFTVWQRLLTTGPLALLPLSDRHSSLVWGTKPDVSTGLKALDGHTFASVINACTQLPQESVNHLLSRISSHSESSPIDSAEIKREIDRHLSSSSDFIQAVDPSDHPPKVLRARMETVASFPLRTFHAEQYFRNSSFKANEDNSVPPGRTALVGDAAHALHPMAGQGLNLGLGDARELGNAVHLAIENGEDIGGLAALARYNKSRYLANSLIMAAVDKATKLYSLDSSAIVWARSLGVRTLNEVPILKAALVASAGGTIKGSIIKRKTALWSAATGIYDSISKAAKLTERFTSQVRLGSAPKPVGAPKR